MIKISLDKAKQEKLFYFVATAVVYRPLDRRCLIIKRSSSETAHPNLWGVIGGKLEWEDLEDSKITKWNYDIPNWDEAIEKLLYREIEEEVGISVEAPRYLTSVTYIRPDHVPVVCAKFAVKYRKGRIKLAPEFSEFAWVNENEIKNYKIIKGNDKEISLAIKAYS